MQASATISRPHGNGVFEGVVEGAEAAARVRARGQLPRRRLVPLSATRTRSCRLSASSTSTWRAKGGMRSCTRGSAPTPAWSTASPASPLPSGRRTPARQRGRRLEPLGRTAASDAALGASGIWEIFIPGLKAGTNYKFEIPRRAASAGSRPTHCLPHGSAPRNASLVFKSAYQFRDADWMAGAADPLARARVDLRGAPRLLAPERGGQPALTYAELGGELAEYVSDGLHARRVAAGHGTPLWAVLGISGDRLLRPDRAVRHARRLPFLVDRLHAPGSA